MIGHLKPAYKGIIDEQEQQPQCQEERLLLLLHTKKITHRKGEEETQRSSLTTLRPCPKQEKNADSDSTKRQSEKGRDKQKKIENKNSDI